MRILYKLLFFTLIFTLNFPTLEATQPGKRQFSNQNPKKFIPNKGQLRQTNGEAADQVRYYFEGEKASVYFRENGWSYVFARKKATNDFVLPEMKLGKMTPLASEGPKNPQYEYYRLDVDVVGANPDAAIRGEAKTKPYYNYYLGHCPDGIEKVYSRKKLVYENIYPGTDLVFYFSNGKLKYDFKVEEGQNPDQIRLQYKGADDLETDALNKLKIETPLGAFEETIPAVYQKTGQGKQFYEGRYEVEGNTVTFQTAQAIQGDGNLVIDPRLDWSTFLGGSGFDNITSVEVNNSQEVIVAGFTSSTDFPADTGAFQDTFAGGGQDAFVSNFSNNGNLNWSTYYGGKGGDKFFDIAFNSSNEILLAGLTQSNDFPTTSNAYQSTGGSDGSIVKLNDSGNQLYSSYYGGSQDRDEATRIAVDTNQNILVGGSTESNNFPTTSNAYSNNYSGGNGDAFLVKFDSAFNRQWATYYGGSGNEGINGLKIDQSNEIIVSGGTRSSDSIATSNVYSDSLKGVEDVFIAEFSQSCQLNWGTYLGGPGNDGDAYESGDQLVIDSANNPIVIGVTFGGTFPTTSNAIKSNPAGFGEGFVAKIDSQGKKLLWSTLIGGSNNDDLVSIGMDDDNRVYVTGNSSSLNYPSTYDRYQSFIKTSNTFSDMGVVTKFNDTGGILWSSYLGGQNLDQVRDLAIDSSENIMVGGYTQSGNFPITSNAYQSTLLGYETGFLTKINCILKPEITALDTTTFCKGDSVTLKATPGYQSYNWTNTSKTDSVITVKKTGNYAVSVTSAEGCYGLSDTITVKVNSPTLPQITYSRSTTLCGKDTITFGVFQSYPSYQWSTGDTTSTIDVGSSGTYSVTVTDSNGCKTTSNPVTVNQYPKPTANIQVNGDTSICSGDSVVLDAGSGYASYQWNTGPTTQTINVTSPDTFEVVVSNGFGCQDTSGTVITTTQNSPSPTITNLGKDTLCFSDTTQLTVDSNYASYQWNTGDTTNTTSVTSAGSYYSTVTNSSGCSGNSDTISIASEPRPTLTPSNDQSICPGDTVTLTAQSGFNSYQWSNGDTAQSIDVTSPGDYYVTGNYQSSCSSRSDTVNVQQKSAPSPTITSSGSTQFCSGNSVTLSTANAYNSYKWSNGDTAQSTVITKSGSYNVTVTNANGCSGTSFSQSVTVFPNPNPTISANGSTDLCQGDTVTLNAGTGYAAYSWSNGATTQTIEVSQTDTVSVTVFNGLGCTGQSSDVIVNVYPNPKPTIIASKGTQTCNQDTLPLETDTTYSSYSWSNGDTSQKVQISQGGSFNVTVTDSNGCTGTSANKSLSIFPNPDPIVKTMGDTSFCQGDSVQVYTDSSFLDYQWSNGDTTRFIYQKDSTSLSVTVTDSNGCKGTSTNQGFKVYSLPNPSVSASGPTVFCKGDSVTLDGASGYNSYQWETDTSGTFNPIQTNTSLKVKNTGSYRLGVMDSNQCFGYSDTYDVFASDPDPLIQYSRTEVLCDNEDSLKLQADTNYVSYDWSNGDTTSSIYVDSNGTFDVFVTDTIGCSDTSQQVTVKRESNPKPTISYASNDTVCKGNMAKLKVNQTFEQYNWDNGDSLRTASFMQSGTYGVTVTDSNGCKGVASALPITVLDTPQPVIQVLDSNVFCKGDSSRLETDTTYDEYGWNNSDTTRQITAFQSDTFRVTATNAKGCSGTSDTQSITVFSNPAPTIHFSPNDTICQGDSIKLTTKNNYSGYQWTNGSNASDTFVFDTDTFDVTVTDNNGCQGVDSQFVKVLSLPNPKLTLSGSDTLCEGESTTIGTAAAYDQYNWNTGASASTITVDTQGSYSVEVTDSNGCIDTSKAQPIIVNDTPQVTINVVDTSVICDDDSTRLETAKGYQAYQWNNNATTRQITVDTAGSYQVTATDANSCSGQSMPQSVTVKPLPQPAIQAQGNDSICRGDSVALTSDQKHPDYQWSTGDTTQTIYAKQEQQYGLTVTAPNGCQNSADSTFIEFIENPQPSISASGPTTFCKGDSVQLEVDSVFDQYQWSNNKVSKAITVKQAGSFTAVVSNDFGCSDTSNAIVTQTKLRTDLPIQSSLGRAFCEEDTTKLSVDTAAYQSYTWSTGTVNEQIEVAQAGKYAVERTDTNNCLTRDTINITVYPKPDPRPAVSPVQGDENFCYGDSLRLELTKSFPGNQWSTGDTTSAVFVDTTQEVFNQITDTNNCTWYSDTLRVVASNPKVSLDALDTNEFCEGGSTRIDPNRSFEAYDWSNGDTVRTITVKQTGNYSLRGIDSIGCTANSDTIDVQVNPLPEPALSLKSDTLACQGDTVNVAINNGPFANYEWNNGDTTAFIRVTEPVSRFATVTDSNACSNKTDTFEVDFKPLPEPAIDSSGPLAFCEGDSVILESPESFANYNWSNGADARSVVIDSTGDYSLTVEDSIGCKGFTDTLQVQADPIEKPDLEPDSPFLCANESITLDPGGGYKAYKWSNGLEQQSIEADSSGAYFVRVSTNRNCSRISDTVQLKVQDPLPQPEIQEQGDSLIANVSASDYQWFRDGNELINETSRMLFIEKSGEYQVTILDSAGCTAQSEPYQVNEVEFTAYPNPVSGYLNFRIETFEPEDIEINLVNLSGKVILAREIENHEGIYRGRLELIGNSPGIYVLKIFTDSEEKEFKFYKRATD